MSQLKFYKYATWGLLFLNIAVLSFFLLTKPGPRQHPPSNNFQAEVIEILNLNNQQVFTFRKLGGEHNQKMKSINEQQAKLLPPYFESLTNLSENIDKNDILNQFQQLEREKIEVTYQHFQHLKSLLNEEQLPLFDEFIQKFIDNILLKKEQNRPPPRPRDI